MNDDLTKTVLLCHLYSEYSPNLSLWRRISGARQPDWAIYGFILYMQS